MGSCLWKALCSVPATKPLPRPQSLLTPWLGRLPVALPYAALRCAVLQYGSPMLGLTEQRTFILLLATVWPHK